MRPSTPLSKETLITECGSNVPEIIDLSVAALSIAIVVLSVVVVVVGEMVIVGKDGRRPRGPPLRSLIA